jgi:AcrR family transcriptional regulator
MKTTERKEQILSNALHLFTRLGYKGTTTAAIAKAADISEVTLFRHFTTKQEIFMKCIEPVFLEVMESTLDLSTMKDPKITLTNLLTERIETISQNYMLVKLVLSEADFISDFKDENILQLMTQKLMVTFEKIGIPKKERAFVLRLVMGSILSFLYLPVDDKKTIETYATELSDMIFSHTTKEEYHA